MKKYGTEKQVINLERWQSLLAKQENELATLREKHNKEQLRFQQKYSVC